MEEHRKQLNLQSTVCCSRVYGSSSPNATIECDHQKTAKYTFPVVRRLIYVAYSVWAFQFQI